MKGIVLAGGRGTRLSPLTRAFSKHLLPIYNKPLIHYPLGTLMLAGIRDILLICNPSDLRLFEALLGHGEEFGINLSYEIQSHPRGIADALIIGEKFISSNKISLILGDNLFYGPGLGTQLGKHREIEGALILAFKVNNPSDFGVVEFNKDGSILRLLEKPDITKSKFAVPGLYFYDETVCEMVKNIGPSKRGELEITDLNNEYLGQGKLKVEVLPRGSAWLDTGTFDSLHDAATFVRIIEERQGQKVSCLEEIALRNGWLTHDEIAKKISLNPQGHDSEYLAGLLLVND